MAQEIIFFDIDGTLLNPINYTFEQSTIETLQTLKNQGYLLGIATGRAYLSTRDIGTFDLIDWDVIVLNNGQKVLNKEYEVIYEEIIQPQIVQEFIQKAHDLDIAVLGQGDGWHFYSDENDHVREVHQHLGEMPVKEDYDENISIYTLMVYGYDYDFINSIDGLRYVHVKGPYADVMLNSVDKYVGISKALDYLGLDSYIAMGDSSNDLEMAIHAKCFIATHRATSSLLEHCDYQVESDYDEIKKGMHWFLNEKNNSSNI